jgi:hypothetical protein
MKRYYVEGMFIPRARLKKVSKGNKPAAGDIEPFARSFWANTPGEALDMASEALEGGQWLETPKISLTSEEERMRRSGAPELPGFSMGSGKAGKKKGKTTHQ